VAGGSLRASDRDRDDVVEHLRKHCVEGRITLEELEERLEGVMAAATVADLSGYTSDLPALDAPGNRAPKVATAPAKAGPVGVLPFAHRVVVPASREETKGQILSTLAPRLAGYGYELVTQSPTGLVFECKSRPPWTILVAIVAFPVGLVALTVKRNERVVISLEPRSTDRTEMVVHGNAPRRVRKAFLGLTF
jgi:Domain of unknown function (DUF1707)